MVLGKDLADFGTCIIESGVGTPPNAKYQINTSKWH